MVLRILGIVLVAGVAVWAVWQIVQLILPVLIVGALVLGAGAGYVAIRRRNRRQIGP